MSELLAVIGIAAPFALGYGISYWLTPESPILAHAFLPSWVVWTLGTGNGLGGSYSLA